MTKQDLFDAGVARMRAWCELNHVEAPRVEGTRDPENFGTCAYYRDSVIYLSPSACAGLGRGGRAWSWPGHLIDRTPYGVIQHELGHHVDIAHGARPGLYGQEWRTATGDKPLTGYRPNDNEWFAEMFRLFVTNPTLLESLRPATYALMATKWKSVETRHWEIVLAGADRQVALISRRIAEADRRRQPVGLFQ